MNQAGKFLWLAFAGWLSAGCGHNRPPAAPAPTFVRGLEVVEVERRGVPDSVEAVGTVRALQATQLSARLVGTVLTVHAEEGQVVRKGEVLVSLDEAQPRAALERASAAVNVARQELAAIDADSALAQATLNRYRQLYETKSVSPHEMDEVQARASVAGARRDQTQASVEQARALESQARADLTYTRLRAPFDGVVTARSVDVGALASPGVPLLTVEDTHRFRLEAAVDEREVGRIELGAAVPVRLDALGTEVESKVVQIVPAADSATRSFLVKLELPSDPRLRSGLFGRARFSRGSRDAIVVPRTAIVDRGQIQGVYVVGESGDIAFRFVTLGEPVGATIELLSGVTAGERVVAAPGGDDLAGKTVAR